MSSLHVQYSYNVLMTNKLQMLELCAYTYTVELWKSWRADSQRSTTKWWTTTRVWRSSCTRRISTVALGNWTLRKLCWCGTWHLDTCLFTRVSPQSIKQHSSGLAKLSLANSFIRTHWVVHFDVRVLYNPYYIWIVNADDSVRCWKQEHIDNGGEAAGDQTDRRDERHGHQSRLELCGPCLHVHMHIHYTPHIFTLSLDAGIHFIPALSPFSFFLLTDH